MTTEAPCSQTAETRDAQKDDVYDGFSSGMLSKKFMTPYHQSDLSWVSVQHGRLVLCGRESFFSQNDPSILATRATSFSYQLQTKLDFHPVHYSQTAGAGLYYDSNNWIYAYVGLSDKEDQRVISILQAKLRQRIAFDFDTVRIPDGAVPELRWQYHYGRAQAFYRLDEEAEWQAIADTVDVSYLSDEGVNGEPGEIGGFTALFNFIGSVDAYQHDSQAEFFYYQVRADQ